jgi:hypothetical protein
MGLGRTNVALGYVLCPYTHGRTSVFPPSAAAWAFSICPSPSRIMCLFLISLAGRVECERKVRER